MNSKSPKLDANIDYHYYTHQYASDVHESIMSKFATAKINPEKRKAKKNDSNSQQRLKSAVSVDVNF